MHTPASILAEAARAPSRNDLSQYREAIQRLRDKKWSWREIAEFLSERGVDTDHTKLIRFIQRQTDRFTVPTRDQYYAALSQLRDDGKLLPKSAWWAMLVFHFHAHNRTVTYTQLAEEARRVGARVPTSKPWTYANREYGTLGKRLGETIGMVFQPSSNRDAPFFSSAIGLDNPARPPGGEYELVMHHELAIALERFLVSASLGADEHA